MSLKFWTTENNPGPTTVPGLVLTLNRSKNAKFENDLEIDGDLNHDGSQVGFYGTAPVNKQTGVAVTEIAIHAALVTLGLIAGP